jgi:PPM family protein phosphatase
MTLRYAARTHFGKRHSRNEDALLIRDCVHQKPWCGSGELSARRATLIAIADGVSTSSAPSVASRTVLTCLRESFRRAPELTPREHLNVTYTKLCEKARTNAKHYRMASTLVAAIVKGDRVITFNSGDSRAYLLAQGRVWRASQDHTLLQRMIDRGELPPERHAEFAHLSSHLATCFVADPKFGPPGYTSYDVALPPGAALLLCSDGITQYVDDHEMASVNASPRGVVDWLYNTAVARGGDDDLSLVLLARS